MRIDTYIQYFKDIAASHVAILHEVENGKEAFASISIDDLYQDDISEVLKKLRSKFKPKSPILLCIKYIWNGYDAGSKNEQKNMQGGFVVLDFYEKGDDAQKTTAQANAEIIVEDVIAKIIENSRAGGFWEYSVNTPNSFSVTPFDRIANYTGWQVVFEFSNFLNIKVNPAKWQ